MLALRGDQVEGLVGCQVFVLPVVDKGDVGQDAVLSGENSAAQRRPQSLPSAIYREVGAHDRGFQSAGELAHARTVPPTR
jgi:hypothetical protein